MNEMNIKGITPSSVGRVLIMLISVLNVCLSMFNKNPVNIDNNLIYDIVSILFVLGMTLYSSYKNFNCSTATQKLQSVLDMVNQGQILMEDVDEMVNQLKMKNNLNQIEENW